MRLTKKQNKTINQYIISCIDSEPYGVQTNTDKEKLVFLYETFLAEYGYNIERVGLHKAFYDYLQGLPTIFKIEFENYKILELATSWGCLSKNPTEKEECKILKNYWNFMATRTLQLIKKESKKNE